MRYNLSENYTNEEIKELARQGGVASGIAKRKKKAMKELAQMVLDMRLDNEDDIEEALLRGGMEKSEATMAAGIIFVQAKRALAGDTKAAEFVRDTSGQKPTDSVQVGNLDDKPFETLNLNALSDAELYELLAQKKAALAAAEAEEE